MWSDFLVLTRDFNIDEYTNYQHGFEDSYPWLVKACDQGYCVTFYTTVHTKTVGACA